MSAGVERLLELAFAALSEAGVEFALIGGCAHVPGRGYGR